MDKKAFLKKPMVQNFISLVFLQGVNYLLPLLSFPFLFRVLGVERWGLISFGYTLIQYFVLFTDFGFNLSATKFISSHREDGELINRYLNSVFICRFLLAVLSFLFLFLLTIVFDRFGVEKKFYLLYFGIILGNMLFPMWYFQGMEKMVYITIFNLVAKTVSFIPFFIFIRKPDDYMLVPVFYSIGYISAGLVSVYMIYVKEKRKWFIPGWKEIRFAFTDSATYFLSRLSVSLFTYSNSLAIGLVCGNVAVGYYSAAEKLYNAYNGLLIPFSSVLFPHMAKTRDVPFFKKALKYITTANIALLAAVLFFSAWLVYLIYGNSAQDEVVSVFRILMCGCLLTIPSVLLGYPFLAAMGHASYTNWTLVFVALFHIAGLFILFVSGFLSIYSVAAMVVLAEILLFSFRIRGVKQFKLFTL